MTFADLTDTSFNFHCTFADDRNDLWQYYLQITHFTDKQFRNLSRLEIVTLRENCKRILDATHGFQGGK